MQQVNETATDLHIYNTQNKENDMNLIFIRHAEPDYSIDSLTEKGWKEAELLSHRTAKWDIKDIYCSPLGRAKDTASFTLKALGREAIIHDWLREFYVPITDPVTNGNRIPWDFMPEWWTKQTEFYHKDNWRTHPVMQTGAIEAEFEKVRSGLDALLSEHGYQRNGNLYDVVKTNDDTLVFFCHLGVQFTMLNHLLGIAAPLLWQGCFVAPSSVTILSSEEREPGKAYFRLKTLGDTAHLYVAGEPASDSGFFGHPFQDTGIC